MTRGIVQDLRFALRALRRRPGFTFVTVWTIALGIGAASAVYAVVDAVVFRPVSYPEPDRLVAMWTRFERQGDFGMSLAEQYDYAEESRALEALGSFSLGSATLTGLGEARPVDLAWTWGGLYGVIGARTVLGRLPGPDDVRSGAPPVVVVSHDFWQAALSGDPAAVGRTLELDGVSVEIIGVMAPGVRLPAAAPSLWRPIARDRADIVDRSGHFLDGVGRLAPGATLATLRTEIDATHARWAEEWAGVHSPGHEGHTLAASELHDRYFGELRSAGLLLIGAVGLVLLLACANVATLLLARGEGRAADLALRRALGAGRGRIVRLLLTESLLLAALGGLLGLGLAGVGADALMALEPGSLPRTETVGVDARVAGFAVLAALFSGIVFGLLPAWRAVAPATRGGRGTTGGERSLGALVVGQVSLAVLLLAGAGLLARSVLELAGADTGLHTAERLTFRVSLPSAAYPDGPAVQEFWSRLLSGVEALPAAGDAAVVRLLPLRDGLRRERMVLVGSEVAPGDEPAVAYGIVTPGYFDVAGIPVVEGRDISAGDDATQPRVGLVNEAAARAYWPDESPVGREVRALFLPDSAATVRIVGVVGDVHAEGVRAPVTPELYLAYAQSPGGVRGGTVVVRTAGDPAYVVAGVRRVVQSIDPRVPLTALASYDDVAADARARERFLATVLAAFGGLALLIAGMGTYGVVAYAVARRRREFGLRLALGAARERVVGSVVADGIRIGLLGAGLGLSGAFLAGPLLDGLLFGVGPRDPVALGAGPAVVGLAVVLACLVPAWRASRSDPMAALREEV